MRKKSRLAGQEEQPDHAAFDQPVALSGSVRDEVAAEANATLSPLAPKAAIASRDCERKSILIPSDDAVISWLMIVLGYFSNSIVASQFQFGTSQFFPSHHASGQRLVADSYTGIVTLGLFEHGSSWRRQPSNF
jgi:hypothetical protein